MHKMFKTTKPADGSTNLAPLTDVSSYHPYPAIKGTYNSDNFPRRPDIKAILNNPDQRRQLITGLIIATQAREGITTTEEQANLAYDKISTEKPMSDEMNSTFVSIDIETTGLDPAICDVLEVGAIIDDWLAPLDDPPTFQCYLKRDQYKGSPYALSMHPKIFRDIATGDSDDHEMLYPGAFATTFANWLDSHEVDPFGFNAAGKNFASFDLQFLKKLPKWGVVLHPRQRIIDIGNLFWDPLTQDRLPNLSQCMEMAGFNDTEVAHTALEDAKVVAKLLQVYVMGRKITKGFMDK